MVDRYTFRMQVLESCLYAEDLTAARGFYVDVLGLEEISFDPERDLFLKAEGSVLIIFKASKTILPNPRIPSHGTTGPGHLAFAATHETIDTLEKKLTAHGVKIIERISWGNGAKSIYFPDPAGNILEFATRDLWFR
jgi:catechol 2,3-dioxygenase-like lactoylglutathione lyase family enzyme